MFFYQMHSHRSQPQHLPLKEAAAGLVRVLSDDSAVQIALQKRIVQSTSVYFFSHVDENSRVKCEAIEEISSS